MKMTFCYLIFLLTLFNATLGFCDGNESSLKLLISKVPDKNKDTIVEVKVVNVSNQLVAFFNDIFYQDNSVMRQLPLSELRFYINKGKGFERLIHPPESYFPYFKPADPNNFLILGPDYIWGVNVYLERLFKMDFPKGNYIIKAEFENRSRSWMYKYFKKEEISQMHVVDPQIIIFDGVIESNYLNIEIGK
jgi:hypothetical protein